MTEQSDQSDQQPEQPVSVETASSDPELVEQARAAGVTVAPAEEALGANGSESQTEDGGDGAGGRAEEEADLFTVEMMSSWGDTWVWTDVDATVSQEVFKMLGEPSVTNLNGGGDSSGDSSGGAESGAVGGELGAE